MLRTLSPRGREGWTRRSGGLDAKQEALRATVWASRARLGRFELGGFGVASGSVHLGCRLDGLESQQPEELGTPGIVPDTFSLPLTRLVKADSDPGFGPGFQPPTRNPLSELPAVPEDSEDPRRYSNSVCIANGANQMEHRDLTG
jgi:hypothetical protein